MSSNRPHPCRRSGKCRVRGGRDRGRSSDTRPWAWMEQRWTDSREAVRSWWREAGRGRVAARHSATPDFPRVRSGGTCGVLPPLTIPPQRHAVRRPKSLARRHRDCGIAREGRLDRASSVGHPDRSHGRSPDIGREGQAGRSWGQTGAQGRYEASTCLPSRCPCQVRSLEGLRALTSWRLVQAARIPATDSRNGFPSRMVLLLAPPAAYAASLVSKTPSMENHDRGGVADSELNASISPRDFFLRSASCLLGR